ncbi:odorant receptor 43a-like [Atheta coriaria]|uniref:odorant receptor 43a-like n=1 Tax=Dalotia coriaria TaxID=877792 RepID=UPI0031F40DC5
MIQQKNVLKLTKSLGDFHYFPKPTNFNLTNTNMNLLSMGFILYTQFGVLSSAFFGVIGKSSCEEESIKLDIKRICGLFFPAYLPQYFNDYPYYQLYVFIQSLNAAMLISSGILVIAFTCGVVELLTCHIANLKRLLSECFDVENEEERKNRLKLCVKYHVHIIKMAEKMNSTLGNATFANATFTGIILAIVFFQFTREPSVKTFIHGFGWLLALFVISYCGQRLINESEGISNCMYFTDWYTADVEAQKYLILIIARSNHYLYLDAKGFGHVCLETFTNALKAAYSFLTLLLNSADDY